MPRVCPRNCGAARCTHGVPTRTRSERTRSASTRSFLGVTWDTGSTSKGSKWRSGSYGSGSKTRRPKW